MFKYIQSVGTKRYGAWHKTASVWSTKCICNIYENSEPHSQRTYPVSITMSCLLMLFRELISLDCKIYVTRIITRPVGKMLSFLVLKKVVNTNTDVLWMESNSVMSTKGPNT
jgi:hypothetical protein